VPGANLKIQNNGTNSQSTALELQVVQDAHPLTVNPGAGKATNLDADKVDGQEASSFVSQADLNADKLWAVVEDDSEGKGNLVRGSGVSSVGEGSGSWDVTLIGTFQAAPGSPLGAATSLRPGPRPGYKRGTRRTPW
jgi:hypothetical protein